MIGKYEVISGHKTWLTFKVTLFILQVLRFFGLLDICNVLKDKWCWSSSTGYNILQLAMMLLYPVIAIFQKRFDENEKILPYILDSLCLRMIILSF